MTVLGLIPARGGSKRLPGKNLVELGGLPLIVWTISAAYHAERLDRTVVSSEDKEILQLVTDWGMDAIVRPPEFATDDADSYCVMLHALDSLEESYDYLCLLQPTSPLRLPTDIDKCISLIVGEDWPAIASFEEGKDVPNGAVYVGRTDWLRDGGNFDGPAVERYDMPAEASIDIDTAEDLAKAEGYVAVEQAS